MSWVFERVEYEMHVNSTCISGVKVVWSSKRTSTPKRDILLMQLEPEINSESEPWKSKDVRCPRSGHTPTLYASTSPNTLASHVSEGVSAASRA